MIFEQLEVTTYGNSKVINVPRFKPKQKVYVIDEDMLLLLRGIVKNE